MTASGVAVEDVPAPMSASGQVLVAVEVSAISAGTELSGIASAEVPLWRRVMREPARAARVARTLAEGGAAQIRDRLGARSAIAQPTGYSLAGVVVEVGPDVHDLRVGDRVACAGAGLANHAELVAVPRNLVVRIPDAVPPDHACTVTLGAIALQGVRRAGPTLGESFAVIGLGILGQMTVQLLRAGGNRVVAIDPDADRLALAGEMGADVLVEPGTAPGHVVDVLTAGVGLDGVIITASTPSDEVVSTAFELCRKKARVVLVGDVGLGLDRADIYVKELDFLVSTSYGPGRYDRRYEDEGLDYPIGHVRWTENRNMVEVLEQMASGRLDVAPLIARSFDVADAVEAYDFLRAGSPRPLIVLLRYPAAAHPAQRRVPVSSPRRNPSVDVVRLGVVGSGSFAVGVHLPNLRHISGAQLRAVCSRTGTNALSVAKQFAAQYATTDPDEVLADGEVDAVLIATRHDLHADLVVRALENGKHVFVEKPLALAEEDLARIDAAVEASDRVVVTGFNRRFAPAIEAVKAQADRRREPLVLSYRMDAGHLPGDHWVHGPEGGGRNRGEACHIYDLFTYLTGSEVEPGPAGVTAVRMSPTTGWARGDDNFVSSMAFRDGSIGSLVYTAVGDGQLGKERLEMFSDGTTTAMDDYRSVVIGTAEAGTWANPDKGHGVLLQRFVEAIRVGGPPPIPYWEQRQATEIANRVERIIASSSSESGGS